MPFLALFSAGKLALYGAIAVAVLGAWGMWTYRGNKIDRLERENAAARVEIAATAATANANAEAAARIRADWEKADALVAKRDREISDVRNRLKVVSRSVRAVAPSSCGPSPHGLALARGLYGANPAVDGAPSSGNPPRPSSKPTRGQVRAASALPN